MSTTLAFPWSFDSGAVPSDAVVGAATGGATAVVSVCGGEERVKSSDATEPLASRVGDGPEVLAELAELSRGGDRRAFGELVRRLQEPLYHAVLRLVGHNADARDIVQRTFLRAWAGREGLKSPQAVRSWVFSIGLNLARNHLRDQGSRHFEPMEENTVSTPAQGASMLVEREERARLRALVSELPPRQRQVIALRIDSELGFKEIAEIVGCTEGAARVNFHHGLKRLREQMELVGESR